MPVRRPAVLLLPTLLLAAACNTGTDPVDDCPDGRCVSAALVTPQLALLTPGDTVRLRADIRTRGGLPTTFRWVTDRSGIVSVSTEGLVTGLARGTDAVIAIPDADSTRFAYASIAVVNPDSTAIPTLSFLTNAATGRGLILGDPRPDSVDVGVSYVLGTLPGEEAAALELRLRGVGRDTTIVVVPSEVTGRASRAAIRLRLGARAANGAELWPAGTYEARVTLRLHDGRVLGSGRVGAITI